MKISINTKVGEVESNIQIEVDENTVNLAAIVSDVIRIIEAVQTPKKVMLTVDGTEMAKASMPSHGGGCVAYPIGGCGGLV